MNSKNTIWVPVIADFGLSRSFTNDQTAAKTSNDTGPLKIMAPECLTRKEYSFASDVWSFAVLLDEIYSRKEPFPDLYPYEVASKVALKDLVPNIPKNMPTVLVEISKACGLFNPSERITMKDVCERLK